MLRQASSAGEAELSELTTQRRQLERQLARDHAEIRRLTESRDAPSGATARLADLHERVAKAERQLAQVGTRFAEVEKHQIDADDVATAFADFDNVWGALKSREQAHVMSLLVARVEFDIADSSIAVSFHSSAIKTLADGRAEDAA